MYTVRAVLIPGNGLQTAGKYASLADARAECERLRGKNALGKPMLPWLRNCDIRVERDDGSFVEYGGPAR